MFTLTEVADRYRVSADTVLTWIEDGLVNAVNVAPAKSKRQHWRFTSEDLAAFESKRCATKPATSYSKLERIRQFV